MQADLLRSQFFACKSGCLDPQCPFLHNKDKAQKKRENVLTERRNSINRPSPKAIQDYQNREAAALMKRTGMSMYQLLGVNSEEEMDTAGDDVPLYPEYQKILEDAHQRIRAMCGRPGCMSVWWKGEEETMGKCSKCKVTRYCSVRSYPLMVT